MGHIYLNTESFLHVHFLCSSSMLDIALSSAPEVASLYADALSPRYTRARD